MLRLIPVSNMLVCVPENVQYIDTSAGMVLDDLFDKLFALGIDSTIISCTAKRWASFARHSQEKIDQNGDLSRGSTMKLIFQETFDQACSFVEQRDAKLLRALKTLQQLEHLGHDDAAKLKQLVKDELAARQTMSPGMKLHAEEDDWIWAFKHFDRDGDGSLSAQEIGIGFSSFGREYNYHDLQELIEVVDLLDVQEDGGINQEEFCSLMGAMKTKRQSSEERLHEISKALSMYDHDKSGFITATDVRIILASLGVELLQGHELTDKDIKDMMCEVDNCASADRVEIQKLVQGFASYMILGSDSRHCLAESLLHQTYQNFSLILAWIHASRIQLPTGSTLPPLRTFQMSDFVAPEGRAWLRKRYKAGEALCHSVSKAGGVWVLLQGSVVAFSSLAPTYPIEITDHIDSEEMVPVDFFNSRGLLVGAEGLFPSAIDTIGLYASSEVDTFFIAHDQLQENPAAYQVVLTQALARTTCALSVSRRKIVQVQKMKVQSASSH